MDVLSLVHISGHGLHVDTCPNVFIFYPCIPLHYILASDCEKIATNLIRNIDVSQNTMHYFVSHCEPALKGYKLQFMV